jgi:phage major head subunit gpT-like protein
MLNITDFSTLLIPIIYHHFDVGMNRVPSRRAQLFSVKGSTLAQENGVGMGGMSPDAWNIYREKGQGHKGRLTFDQLYTQIYTHQEYPVQVVIQKKLLINDQYNKIGDYARRVGISAEQKMEIDAAGLLNNAFSTSYNLSDGKPLCSTTHPKGPHNSSALVNKGTSALSETSVTDTRIAMMRFKDDKGNEVGIMPNELWVPPELEDTALKIVKSVQEPGTANNAINPQAGRWTVIPWMRLSDTNNWFMTDGVWRQEVVNWYNRETTTPMLVHEDTTDLVYEFKLHYSFGADDWRWIYGHEVTGA